MRIGPLPMTMALGPSSGGASFSVSYAL